MSHILYVYFIIIFTFLSHDDPFTTLHLSISSSKELPLLIAGVTFAVLHGLLLTLLVTERGWESFLSSRLLQRPDPTQFTWDTRE